MDAAAAAATAPEQATACTNASATTVAAPTESGVTAVHPTPDAEAKQDTDTCLFHIERARSGRAVCKDRTCRKPIAKDEVRIGRIYRGDPRAGDHDTTTWHHVECFFRVMSRARASTRTIESEADFAPWQWEALSDAERDHVRARIRAHVAERAGRKRPATGASPATTAGAAALADAPEWSSSSCSDSLDGESSERRDRDGDGTRSDEPADSPPAKRARATSPLPLRVTAEGVRGTDRPDEPASSTRAEAPAAAAPTSAPDA